MKLDLNTERPSEIRETVSFPPEEEAVRVQDEIVRLKLRIEELESQRDEAIAKALANGVRVYGGYRFAAKSPTGSLSEKKLAELYPDVMDGFIAWYQQTHEAKLSKAELTKYLKSIDHVNPDKVVADIFVPGKGEGTVTITKLKEAGE